MILNSMGVVLARRNAGEADRLVTLFTEDMGKIEVRFIGANKSKARLKALSEPMMWGEYRLHLSPRSEFGKAIGGRIIDSFPGIRADFSRTVEGLACCELLAALTPHASPNPEKYRLIREALAELDAPSHSPWLVVSFGLKLLDLAGFRMENLSLNPEERRIGDELHEMEFQELSGIPCLRDRFEYFRGLLYHHAEVQIGRKLKSRVFLDQMIPADHSRPLQAAAC